MARRKNYGFEKRQRELRKQEKKREKEERRKLADPSASENGTVEEHDRPEAGLRDQD